ncbi:Nuclear pore complex protein Nup93 [Schistosoma japonicum]|nr:Nuclear pore complex protein Nup93 [Schistosoma japonicum]
MDITLDDLVQESEKLLMNVQEDNDLPHITRSLDQMRHLGEKLYLSRGSNSDVKAARLLGPKLSYELPQNLTSKLENLVSTDVHETFPFVPKTDIQSFLRVERDNALLTAVLMTRKSMFEEVEERCDSYLQTWWEQEAAGVLSGLSGSSGPLDTELTCLPDLEYYDHSDTVQRQAMQLTRDELLYANQLDYFLTIHLTSVDFTPIQNGVPHDLLTYLARDQDSISCEKQLKNLHSDVAELWSLMKRISYRMRSDHGSELSYDRPLEVRASLSVQNTLSMCSLEHLESEFLEFMKITVANQPRLARLGGHPGTRSLVRAYLSLRLPSENITNVSAFNDFYQLSEQNGWEFDDGLVDGVPVWPMLFYCLRTGDTQVTLEVARDALNNLGSFVPMLEDYVKHNRRLRTHNQARIRQTCKQVAKSTRDPYKRLMYSILGQCDLNENYSDIVSNIDDFLWIKISQVVAQEPTESVVSSKNSVEDTLTLGQLQTLLYETYGEVHFDAWSQPLVFFKILCLTQQYEAAIGFLARFEQLRCHAVHIALVLKDLHLLLLPNWLHSPLVIRNEYDPTGFRRLNLARLIMLYTRKFEATDPEKALMYYYMLSDVQVTAEKSSEEKSNTTILNGLHNITFERLDAKNHNLFVQCVCELALGNKELDLLLGCVSENDIRKPGAIDRFCKSAESRRELVRTVADVFESSGQLVEAIHLYLLASSFGDPKRDILVAVTLINTVLSSVIVTSDLGMTPKTQSRFGGQLDRNSLLQLATEIARKVRRLGLSTDDNDFLIQHDTVTDMTESKWTIKILFYLLDLAAFFDLVDAERWQAAIDHIDQLGLFPVNSQPSNVEYCATLFSQLPDLVRRPLPWALCALMRCLSAKCGRVASVTSNATRVDGTSKVATSEIRARAKALIAYVGRLPHRLPSEIYAGLTQMDMEIM